MQADRQTFGIALMLAAALSYATLPMFAVLAYRHGADATGVLLIRFLIGAPVLVLVARRSRPVAPPVPLRRLVPLGMAFFLQTWTFFLTLDELGAVLAVMLLFLYPLLVWLISTIYFGESRTAVGAGGAIAAVAGVVLCVGTGGTITVLGLGFGVVTALAFAAYMLGAKQLLLAGISPLRLTGAIYAVSAAGYVFVAASRGLRLPVDAPGWLAIGGVAIIGTLVAGVLFTVALERLPAGTAATVSATEPAMAVLLAAVVLGETITPWQAVGVGVLCAAVATLARSAGRPVAGDSIAPG